MAATRTPKSPDAVLRQALDVAWQARQGQHACQDGLTVWGVACSGGRDSMALLHVAVMAAQARCETGQPTAVWALHVHHGLHPAADAWQAQVAAQCDHWRSQGWPVDVDVRALHLRPLPGDSVEALAREGRYLALGEMARMHGCDVVWLGHHRRDQAETLLLQALRGGGVAGLASMPALQRREGVWWARPWLGVSRETIEAHMAACGLSHVDDDSNHDPRWARNRLRIQVWPALTQAYPEAEASLALAAQHQADALASLADWLAMALPRVTRMDADGLALLVPAWLRESAPLQRQLLRGWFAQASGQGLSLSWVQRLQAELPQASARAWTITLDGVNGGELRLYREVLRWVPAANLAGSGREATPRDALRLDAFGLGGLGDWAIPGADGDGPTHVHVREAAPGEWGLSRADLAAAHWRWREGGEQFQLGAGRPARALKKQFQALGVPSWGRQAPLLWLGDELLWVPALGWNHACARLVLAPAAGADVLTLSAVADLMA